MYSAWTGRVDVEGGVEARAGVSQLAVLRCPSWGFCSPGGGPGSECGDGPDTAQSAQVQCPHSDHLAALRLRSRDTTNHEGEPEHHRYLGWVGQDEEEFVQAGARTRKGGEPGTAGSGIPAAVAVVFPRSRFGGGWWCLDDRRPSPQVAVVLCRASRAASLRFASPCLARSQLALDLVGATCRRTRQGG